MFAKQSESCLLVILAAEQRLLKRRFVVAGAAVALVSALRKLTLMRLHMAVQALIMRQWGCEIAVLMALETAKRRVPAFERERCASVVEARKPLGWLPSGAGVATGATAAERRLLESPVVRIPMAVHTAVKCESGKP